jgi:hypothetical protein
VVSVGFFSGRHSQTPFNLLSGAKNP